MRKSPLLSILLAACAAQPPNPGNLKEAPLAQATRMELKDPPLLGTTPAGQRIYLGGFSGLRYLGRSKTGKLRFLTHTDRGPNTDEIEEGDATKRPFLLPAFQPRLLILEADPEAGTLKIEKEIPLKRPDGKSLTGLPQAPGQEEPIDSTGKKLSLDPYGMDLEGIVQAADGAFWMVEEYGPTVARFSRDGKLLETLKPGRGLPKVLEHRRLNRGFEGAALLGNRLYAVLQSPLDNPPSKKAKNSKESSVVRIVEVDLPGRRTLGQFAYLFSQIAFDGEPVDKIGDIAVVGPRNLLVLEHNGEVGEAAIKRVYQVSLEGATNLQLLPERVAGPGGTLEGMGPVALAAAGVVPARKERFVDLVSAGITEEKVEGVELVEDRMLAVAVDNDFGLNGELDRNTGLAGTKGERPVIYLIREPQWVEER